MEKEIKFITIREAAEKTGLRKDAIISLIKQGMLTTEPSRINIMGEPELVSDVEIDRLIKKSHPILSKLGINEDAIRVFLLGQENYEKLGAITYGLYVGGKSIKEIQEVTGLPKRKVLYAIGRQCFRLSQEVMYNYMIEVRKDNQNLEEDRDYWKSKYDKFLNLEVIREALGKGVSQILGYLGIETIQELIKKYPNPSCLKILLKKEEDMEVIKEYLRLEFDFDWVERKIEIPSHYTYPTQLTQEWMIRLYNYPVKLWTDSEATKTIVEYDRNYKRIKNEIINVLDKEPSHPVSLKEYNYLYPRRSDCKEFCPDSIKRTLVMLGAWE